MDTRSIVRGLLYVLNAQKRTSGWNWIAPMRSYVFMAYGSFGYEDLRVAESSTNSRHPREWWSIRPELVSPPVMGLTRNNMPREVIETSTL